MSIFTSKGFVAGIFISIFVLLLIYKLANTDHRSKTAYDERQQLIRGKGYMYGFYTIVIYECIIMAISVSGIELPAVDFIIHFAGILLGCIVLASYNIWKGVYWGLNNNPKRYAVVFIALLVLNAIPVFGSIKDGSIFENGKLSIPFLNVLVLLMLTVLVIELFVKHLADKSSEERDA